MIGLYEFEEAHRRYKRGTPFYKGDAKALWAGIATATNAGAYVDQKDYGKALKQAAKDLQEQLSDGQDVEEMIDWTSKQSWAKKGLADFEAWLISGNKRANVLSNKQNFNKTENIMSNKKEIAKIAREIKEIKAELGKSSSPLEQNHLSSEDYQKAKKLKGFNKADWKWNSKTDLYDKV